jgi:hypothetical protein
MSKAYQNPHVADRTQLYAVLTGDVTGSSSFPPDNREGFLQLLRSTLDQVLAHSSTAAAFYGRFEIFRGDSFQGILMRPEEALQAAISIRAALRSNQPHDIMHTRFDARIAIGVGMVDFLPKAGSISEGDGEAYRLSGPTLDAMKGERHLAIKSLWSEINEELDTECALLDVLIAKWTREQAEAILWYLRKDTQRETAIRFEISQPAVQLRLKSAGSWAVERFCKRYKELIKKISIQTNKGNI